MKKLLIPIASILIASCGGENSDGSKSSTYSSCSITSSKALFAIDRANDVSQCWDGVDYKEKDLALDWCRKKVNTYLGKYTFGHGVEFQVASTNCP